MKKGDAMKQEKRIYIRKYVSAIIFSNIIVWFSWALPLILLDGIKLNDEYNTLLNLGIIGIKTEEKVNELVNLGYKKVLKK